MVDAVEVQKVVFQAFGNRTLGLEKKVIDDGMTIKCLLNILGNDAGAHIIFKYAIDDRTVGRDDQKVALARDVSYTARFPGQILLL